MEIKNSNFIGVKWDGESIKSVEYVAEALYNLTKLFITQNIKIDNLVKINTFKEDE